jgi:hypothetical protein
LLTGFSRFLNYWFIEDLISISKITVFLLRTVWLHMGIVNN